MMPEYADPDAKRNARTANTKTTDGYVPAGNGNNNKVWATDNNGDPAWRNPGGTVTDGNPTLAWGQQSTVGNVNGTDLHVTMPGNPDTWRPVIDDLTHTDTDKSLSANQGKELNDKITTTVISNNISSGLAAGSIKAYKKGNSVILEANEIILANSLPAGSSAVIGVVPDGYRPSVTTFGLLTIVTGGVEYVSYIKVLTNGNVELKNTSPSGTKAYASFALNYEHH